MFNITTSQGPVNIEIPSIVEWKTCLRPVTNVGIKISGGADSAILSYILALEKRDFRPDVKLVPITIIKPRKPYHEVYAKRVIEKITQLTGVTFEPHMVYYPDPSADMIQAQLDFLDQIYNDWLVDCHFYGETLNPDPNDPTFVSIRTDNNYGYDRDTPSTLKNGPSSRPFRNINKKAIHEIYNHFGVLEELFPITRSCEAVKQGDGDEWMKHHCQQCWFCNERFWGFGRYT